MVTIVVNVKTPDCERRGNFNQKGGVAGGFFRLGGCFTEMMSQRYSQNVRLSRGRIKKNRKKIQIRIILQVIDCQFFKINL